MAPMLLKNMVGPCGLEPQTSTVSTRPRGLPKYAEVAQDIIHCGLECGLEINTEASPFCIFYSTNKLFTLWICATQSKFLDISGLDSPTARRHKLFSNAPVSGGGTMRVRYQRGYLRLGQRKKGPDRWEFLWWDSDPTGVRVRRKAVIGTVEQYSNLENAWQAMACAYRSTRLAIVSANRP
jgi:hypothetical protein